jgi:hypothetical protein
MQKNNGAIREAVSPVLDAELSLRDMKIILAEMFAKFCIKPTRGRNRRFYRASADSGFPCLNRAIGKLTKFSVSQVNFHALRVVFYVLFLGYTLVDFWRKFTSWR